ncbi:MAG: N-acetyltransferase [Myxococcales bacterium]|nr:N-acetyltransferase [Myxococcales bacterium]
MSECFIHSTAVVDDGAELGPDSSVWHFVHVSAGAHIGARCVLGQNVFVGRGVTLGDGVRVQNNVSIYQGVEVADDVFLGPSCVFTNVLNPRAHVQRKDEFRMTRVGRGATVGANATIVCGHDIGDFAMVGAGSVVTHTVSPHALVYGNPARRHGWVCRCGEILDAKPRPRCSLCGDRYAIDTDRCIRLEES